MDNFKNLKSNDVTFDEYTSWFEKYKNKNDFREINFQNEVVKPFIRGICNDLDVEVTDKKGPDSSKHDYFQYCGTYIDEKNGKEKAVTPDLVIAQNWNWLNNENHVDYRAVVEVKSPYSNERIYNKDYKKYDDNFIKKLECHLSAKNNSKLILTDAMKWEFYIKNEKDKKTEPIRIFKLYDLYSGGKWEWKKEEFEELKNFLKEFLNREN